MSSSKKSKSLKRKRESNSIQLSPIKDIKPVKEALIQFPFVDPLTTETIIPNKSANCTQACKNAFFEIKTELKALKKLVTEQTNLLQQLAAGSGAPLPALEDDDSPLKSFPLHTEEDLKDIEKHINDDNMDIYVLKMRELIQGNVGHNLRNILSDEIILSCNLNGFHGKKRLRDYEKFCSALLDAINTPEEKERPEPALRHAIQVQKKRCFRRKSARKAKEKSAQLFKVENNDDEEEDDDEYSE